MIPSEVSEALLDVLVQGIRSGDRPERDRQKLATMIGAEPQSLAEWFPDEDALFVHALQTLLAGFGQTLRDAHTSARRADSAYLWASVPGADAAQRVDPEPKAAALMLLILCNDAALREAQRVFACWQQLVSEDAGNAVDATLARVLADGWWFIHSFGLGEQLDQSERGSLRLRLADISGSTPQ
jgi:hypothetical protein